MKRQMDKLHGGLGYSAKAPCTSNAHASIIMYGGRHIRSAGNASQRQSTFNLCIC